jgi:RNA polymerase sigma factor for flagellar operon FliA
MTSPSPLRQLTDTLSVVETVLQRIGRRLPLHVSREDLASAGKVALVEALLRFSGPPHEARAYCYTRVHGAVLDELRRLDPLPRRTRARVTRIARATVTLMGELGREPADFEVAEATGLTAGQVREAGRFAAAETCPLDEAGAELHDRAAPCPAESAENGDAVLSVRAALERLPANQALALRRYYLEDATLDEIARELGVSRERARQIREAGEKKLRADFVVLALWQSFLVRR